MNCPTCADERLVLSERSGIEIDYCPVCRGVWLDRGELDKIIDRVGAAPRQELSGATSAADERRRSSRPPGRYDEDYRGGGGKGKPKKKSSFLSDLFEMGG